MSIVSQRLACDSTASEFAPAVRQKALRLFRPWTHKLFRTAMGVLGCFHSAQDVLQETFVSFTHTASRGDVKCLDERRLADIEDAELERYAASLRQISDLYCQPQVLGLSAQGRIAAGTCC